MSSAERVLVNESTVPDPGNAGVGKIFYFPPPMEVFFMGNEEKRTNPIVDFFRKNMWVLTVIFAVCAILITFLPVLKYEIRETVYDSATGDRLFKTDYTYRMNLISYFSTGFTYNFSFFITIGMVAIGGILAFVGKFKKELTTISGIFFLLALCFFILSKEFFSAEGNNIMDNAKIVGTVYDEATQTFDASFHGAYLSWGSAFAITFCALALDHLQVLVERGAQHFGGVEVPALPEDGQHAGAAVEEGAQRGVVGAGVARAARGAERRDFRVFQRKRGDGPEVLLVERGGRVRPAALDVVHAELVEKPGQLELVGQRQRNSAGLVAVAEGGVVDADLLGVRRTHKCT